MIQMNTNSQTTVTLLPGDAIERQGPLGTMHRGIFAGFDALGRACVIHNPKGACVRYDFYDVFANGQPVKLIKRAARTEYERSCIVQRAHSRLGEPYDLLTFNCDHLVTYALGEVANSPQLGAVVGVVLIAGLVGAAVVATSA